MMGLWSRDAWRGGELWRLRDMSKQSSIEQQGEILEALSNATFKIRLKNTHVIMARLSGKMRMRYVKILPGDWVKVELSPYDLSRGRIVYRLNKKDMVE